MCVGFAFYNNYFYTTTLTVNNNTLSCIALGSCANQGIGNNYSTNCHEVLAISSTDSLNIRCSHGADGLIYVLAVGHTSTTQPTNRGITTISTPSSSSMIDFMTSLLLSNTSYCQIFYKYSTDSGILRSLVLDLSLYPTISKVAGSDAIIISSGFITPPTPQLMEVVYNKKLNLYGGKSFIHYCNSSSSNKGSSIIQTWGNTNFVNKGKTIGLAKTNINTQGTIILAGGIYTTSGLSQGVLYYVGDDGKPSTTINDYPFGIALSSTQLLYSPQIIPSSTSINIIGN